MKRLGYSRGKEGMLTTMRLGMALAAALAGVIWGVIRKHRRPGGHSSDSTAPQKLDAEQIISAVRLAGFCKQPIAK